VARFREYPQPVFPVPQAEESRRALGGQKATEHPQDNANHFRENDLGRLAETSCLRASGWESVGMGLGPVVSPDEKFRHLGPACAGWESP